MIIKNLLFSAFLSLVLMACAFAQEGPAYFGEKISAKGALTPTEFVKEIEGKGEANTKLKATINDVCQMKGCWMTLDMGDGQEVMVQFKDYGFFVPKDVAGKTAVVAGHAFVDIVSVETLRHYAEDAGKSKAEIEAITKPEQRISFMADGVIIEE